MLQTVSIGLAIDIPGLTPCLFLAGLLASLHGIANAANRFLIAFLPIYAPAELIDLGFVTLFSPIVAFAAGWRRTEPGQGAPVSSLVKPAVADG